ncbi:hypothetical protein QYF36_013819 [Acer negundo]|nr:hypothetical protein QYF36_013819 [Acer negundo]
MKGLPCVGTVGKFWYSVPGGLFSSKAPVSGKATGASALGNPYTAPAFPKKSWNWIRSYLSCQQEQKTQMEQE